MNISLDYDNTYTRDPIFWDEVILLAKRRGHSVFCVTMRYEHEGKEVKEALENKVESIFFTGRKAKDKFMFGKGISIDVWLDDIPFFCCNDAIIT